MSLNWEDTFTRWASPPSPTEQGRIDNTIVAIRKALAATSALSDVTRLYVQGSYRNRVNVRQESDVDIGVLYSGNSFGADYPEGMGDADFGNTAATYTYRQFKNDVEVALVSYFGRSAIHRGNKAFDVHENTYRIDADVVPMFVHRRYGRDRQFICGVEFVPDSGGRVVNWPERLYESPRWPNQHYENAVSKNAATGRRYKGVVRILKSLRNEMEAAGVAAAVPVCGFLVECLVWNVPAGVFGNTTWDRDVQASLLSLWTNTKAFDPCAEWREVSQLKYLFRGSSDLKRQQAHAFVDAAWSYIGVR